MLIAEHRKGFKFINTLLSEKSYSKKQNQNNLMNKGTTVEQLFLFLKFLQTVKHHKAKSEKGTSKGTSLVLKDESKVRRSKRLKI